MRKQKRGSAQHRRGTFFRIPFELAKGFEDILKQFLKKMSRSTALETSKAKAKSKRKR